MIEENKIIQFAKPYLDNCRPGDFKHALRVVKWVKILGKENENLNLIVLAAYIHDIGWAGVLRGEKVDFDKMKKLEGQANLNSERFSREVMEKLNLSSKDMSTVLNLIKAADKHKSNSKDEGIIVDADNLSKLCGEHVREKYSRESYQKIVDLWEKEFPNRLKTEKGKKTYSQLLRKLKEDLNLV